MNGIPSPAPAHPALGAEVFPGTESAHPLAFAIGCRNALLIELGWAALIVGLVCAMRGWL